MYIYIYTYIYTYIYIYIYTHIYTYIYISVYKALHGRNRSEIKRMAQISYYLDVQIKESLIFVCFCYICLPYKPPLSRFCISGSCTYLFVACVQTKHWYCNIYSILNQNKVIPCSMSSPFLQRHHECSCRENALYSLKSQHSLYLSGFPQSPTHIRSDCDKVELQVTSKLRYSSVSPGSSNFWRKERNVNIYISHTSLPSW